MLSYCWKYRKNTESKNPKVVRTKNERITLLSKCVVCDSKKWKFINPEERGLPTMVYKFFDKKSSGGTIEDEYLSNEELAEELHKKIIGNFKKWKVYSSFIDNILCADLADLQLISKFDKGIRFLLFVTDIFGK